MVRWVRKGRAKAGKMSQAVQWAKEIAEYINKKHGVPVAAYVEKFGEIGTIRWFICPFHFARTLIPLLSERSPGSPSPAALTL